jgi:dimethylargininase
MASAVGFGGQSATAELNRVFVRPLTLAPEVAWTSYGWREPVDPARLREEHDEFVAQLRLHAEVIVGTPDETGNPDAIYACDPALMTDRGAILLRPGKKGRRGEPFALEKDLDKIDVPVVGRLEAPATAEGGDMMWLDPETLIVGKSYRTNDVGIDALRQLLPDVEVLAFDLPHLAGPGEVLHLLSLFSPLDDNLVIGYLPLLPVRLVEVMHERGIQILSAPEDEFHTLGTNVLCLGPRMAMGLGGNYESAQLMRSAGVHLVEYSGGEVSLKGSGGPTCLTLALQRS